LAKKRDLVVSDDGGIARKTAGTRTIIAGLLFARSRGGSSDIRELENERDALAAYHHDIDRVFRKAMEVFSPVNVDADEMYPLGCR